MLYNIYINKYIYIYIYSYTHTHIHLYIHIYMDSSMHALLYVQWLVGGCVEWHHKLFVNAVRAVLSSSLRLHLHCIWSLGLLWLQDVVMKIKAGLIKLNTSTWFPCIKHVLCKSATSKITTVKAVFISYQNWHQK